ncbi:MAG: DUF366 family protein [Bdellovibrionales bacterium]|nr:DUF366 family protein [Bdellovibrionales bacterium]
MKTQWMESPMPYLGPELKPHFILSKWKIEGSTLVAFRGPCDVKTEHLVDWEDRLQSDFIRAREMVHFLGEFFGITLKEGIWIQRLLVSEWCVELLKRGIEVSREGDDLFVGGKKLSVSIVTASPVSVLLHLGINIDPEGAPVSAVGLGSLLPGVKVEELAARILSRFQNEYQSVDRASVKVRPVI